MRELIEKMWRNLVGARPIDKRTGRPYGDHGTAADAIEFALDDPKGEIDVISVNDTRNPIVRSVLAHAKTLCELDEARATIARMAGHVPVPMEKLG